MFDLRHKSFRSTQLTQSMQSTRLSHMETNTTDRLTNRAHGVNCGMCGKFLTRTDALPTSRGPAHFVCVAQRQIVKTVARTAEVSR